MRVQLIAVAVVLSACGQVPAECVTRCGLRIQTRAFCEMAQRIEDKTLEAYTGSQAVTDADPRFLNACERINGWEVTQHDGTFSKEGYENVNGLTLCDYQTIDFTTPASFAHELAHAVQGCHSEGPVAPGMPADHPGWLPIYSAYSKIKW